MMCILLCTGCTALPAEERAFAVVLGVDHAEGVYHVYARIPTYKSGGEYATIGGAGDTLDAALSALDGASPMHLHLDQLRLLIFTRRMAGTDAFPAALAVLSERHDLRMQCAVAVTRDEMQPLFDAMEPTTGARLSKSLDVMLQTRKEQGIIPDANLADILRMGERQSPVLIALTHADKDISLTGGWPVSLDGRITGEALTGRDMQLLSLMQGHLRQVTLPMDEGTAHVTDASAEARVTLPTMNAAAVRMTLRVTASDLTEEALRQAVATACLRVLNRLSGAGCDALGLGRDAMQHMTTMQEWHNLNWPARYADLDWTVSVGVQRAAGA